MLVSFSFFLFFLSVILVFFYFLPMSFNSSVIFYFFIYDEISLFMVFMSCFVVYVSMVVGLMFSRDFSMFFSLILMLIFCIIVFSCYNMFFLYLFYEASLVPILYIIMKWGSYPERSLSSIMLFVYTSLFTFPFLYVIVKFYFMFSSLVFNIVDSEIVASSIMVSFIVFFTFSVKLPIYGLHYWLPMAHVEAPTFGSMLLAGVLLKLGGIGIVRFSYLMMVEKFKFVLVGYLAVFLVFVTLLCCMQSDFKRLVAYSSVSHMMSVPILFLSSSFTSLKGIIVVMFMHGISSPIMFMFVGVLYSILSTRQHIVMRGFIIGFPLISFLMVLSFFFTLSAPPFPSFISEVLFVVAFMNLWSKSFIFIFIFLFLSLVYNLLWLSSILFYSFETSPLVSFNFNFIFFLPIVLSLLVSIIFSVLFYFI